MNIFLPDEVKTIISALASRGFDAYAVGGCVRDSLLGVTPKDWDLATSATPEEVLACFDGYRVLETGLRHGTVAVLMSGVPYEITTFRVDGDYSDNRRPDSVEFVRDIGSDLSRRDFTVNAMAYSSELIDPFGGVRDLEERVIRCVGDPDARFREDALRILRALRFSSELGFEIERRTLDALLETAESLRNVAAERVSAELSRLLLGKNALYALTVGRAALAEIPVAVSDASAEAIAAAPRDLTTRLALLFLELGADGAADALRRLRYSRAVIRDVKTRVKNNDPYGARPALRDLTVTGADMLALGYSGRRVGEALDSLLQHVASGELPNTREALLAEARRAHIAARRDIL
ncbi:MAG: tRNA nucleotidyltransferase [Oscillospiraceae bacterium]|jgi:tRNA nucleotidyltransferase (CCA-adding enzyme)|nr:tRNA nucleotidyltransferase [Oscillospiraceae bacterium]